MGRPATRTARVGGETLGMLREVFGTSTQAFDRLRLRGLVRYPTFYRAWSGDAVTPGVVRAVGVGWKSFMDRLIERYQGVV